jgi:hypothetical protein
MPRNKHRRVATSLDLVVRGLTLLWRYEVQYSSSSRHPTRNPFLTGLFIVNTSNLVSFPVYCIQQQHSLISNSHHAHHATLRSRTHTAPGDGPEPDRWARTRARITMQAANASTKGVTGPDAHTAHNNGCWEAVGGKREDYLKGLPRGYTDYSIQHRAVRSCPLQRTQDSSCQVQTPAEKS